MRQRRSAPVAPPRDVPAQVDRVQGLALVPVSGPILDTVNKLKYTNGFTVLYRRWVVERTCAWKGRCRRLAKDYERTLESSLAWSQLAACRFLMRRVAREANN